MNQGAMTTARWLPAATLLAMVLTSGSATAKTLVLDHFTLIDGSGAAPKANSAMIVENGKITWVGSSARMRAPAGATVEDLAGKFVMPGIIDSHVHLGLVDGITQNFKYYTRANVENQLHTYAAYGVTAVQVLGTDGDVIHDIVRDLRTGPVGMARVFSVGRGVVAKGSYGGVAGLEASVSTPAEAVAMVDREKAKGADLIKFWMDDEFGTIDKRMPYDISAAVIGEAHKVGLKAVGHVFYYDNGVELIRERVDGFGHEIRDRVLDQPFLAAMKKAGTTQLSATLSREASFTYDLLPFADEPFFSRGVTPAVVAALKAPERRQRLASAPLFARYPGVFDNAMKNFGLQLKAGVPYGMGTDSGPTARFPGYTAHWEMELMVKAGATPLQVLTAATSTNARFIGATDLGTLAVGKQADILVLDRNPAADIRNTRSIARVYVAGEAVPTIWQTCAGRSAADCGDAR